MPTCVYITDPAWIECLQREGISQKANFWRKDQRSLNLLPGDNFYFKLRGSKMIAGRGRFLEQLNLSIDTAWERFGLANGVGSSVELKRRAQDVLGLDGQILNCLVLTDLELLPEAKRPVISNDDFPSSTQGGKYYKPGSLPEIEATFRRSEELPSLLSWKGDEQEFNPEYVSSARAKTIREICVRRGQQRFRNSLITAYESKCAVSSEGTLEILEAAHIHPYVGEDTNHPTNGLLLRADLHTLFDLGLWTVDEDFCVHLSSRLTSPAYQTLGGALIRLPIARSAWPSRASLRYHREKIFYS